MPNLTSISDPYLHECDWLVQYVDNRFGRQAWVACNAPSAQAAEARFKYALKAGEITDCTGSARPYRIRMVIRLSVSNRTLALSLDRVASELQSYRDASHAGLTMDGVDAMRASDLYARWEQLADAVSVRRMAEERRAIDAKYGLKSIYSNNIDLSDNA